MTEATEIMKNRAIDETMAELIASYRPTGSLKKEQRRQVVRNRAIAELRSQSSGERFGQNFEVFEEMLIATKGRIHKEHSLVRPFLESLGILDKRLITERRC